MIEYMIYIINNICKAQLKMQQLTDMLAKHCDSKGYVFQVSDISIDNGMLFGMSGAFPLFAYMATQTLKDGLGDEGDLGVELVNDESALLNIRAEMDFSKPFSFQALFMLDAVEEYVAEMRKKMNNYDEDSEFVIPIEPLIEKCSMTSEQSPSIIM